MPRIKPQKMIVVTPKAKPPPVPKCYVRRAYSKTKTGRVVKATVICKKN